ncbi:MAG: hypothetical protein ACRDFS_01380 [Chloroflexota bacterium]
MPRKLPLLVALLAAGLPGHFTASAAVPAQIPAACGSTDTSPMQGHYTGSWQSSANYTFTGQFATFSMTIQMQVAIDGKLDITVDDGGHVTGTASGNVNAPIFRDGKQDISSGLGTISGPLSGTIGTGVELVSPVIDMNWGTFGGHAIERFITMPNYQLETGQSGCVSAQGTISEEGFPLQNLVADGTGEQTQAPGIGSAAGSWQASSDESSTFDNLSQQVDGFLSNANLTLQQATLDPGSVDTQIVQPLQQLVASIQQHPDVSRCLLERLYAWEATAAQTMDARVVQLAGTGDLASVSQGRVLLGQANDVGSTCGLGDGGAAAALVAADQKGVSGAVRGEGWASLALWLQESGLAGGAIDQPALNADFHALLANRDSNSYADAARAAYAFGDTSDVRPVARALSTQYHFRKAKKLGQILVARLSKVRVSAPSGSPVEFAWQPVPGAQTYVVTVKDSGGTSWTWSGPATAVTYGTLAVPGTTDQQRWPASGATGWSLLAIDARGAIIAGRLRMKI